MIALLSILLFIATVFNILLLQTIKHYKQRYLDKSIECLQWDMDTRRMQCELDKRKYYNSWTISSTFDVDEDK